MRQPSLSEQYLNCHGRALSLFEDETIQFMSPEPGVKHQEVTTQGELMTAQDQRIYDNYTLKIKLHRLRAMGVIIDESEAYLDDQGNVRVRVKGE